MLAETFTLVLQLPPLVFGPALPPPAFAPPRELTCEVRDLGRPQPLSVSPAPAFLGVSLDARTLKPPKERYLVNPVVDGLLVLGAMAATRGTWDDRSWSTKTWQATGAVAPILIPLQPPPLWSVGH